MEVAVEIPELRRVVILGHCLERLERGAHDLDLLVGHRLDGAPDHLALDDASEVVQSGEVVEVDAGGDGRALRAA